MTIFTITEGKLLKVIFTSPNKHTKTGVHAKRGKTMDQFYWQLFIFKPSLITDSVCYSTSVHKQPINGHPSKVLQAPLETVVQGLNGQFIFARK